MAARRAATWRIALLAAFFLLTISSGAAADTGLAGQVKQATALRERGSLADARKRFENLLPALEQAHEQALLASACNQLSVIAAAQGQYTLAASRALQSARLYHSLGDPHGEAQALNNVGVSALYESDYPRASDFMQRSLALYQSVKDLDGEAEQWSNLGNVRFFQGSYLDALHAYEQSGRLAGGSPRRQQLAQVNLATLYQRIGRYGDALALYRNKAASSQSLRPSERARELTNQGALYRRLGDPIKALATYRQADALFAQEHHLDGELGVLRNIGIVLALDLHQFADAEQVFRHALTLAEDSHNERQALQTRLYLGEIYHAQHHLEAAAAQFQAALTAAQAQHAVEEEWKALYGLGRIAPDAATAAARFREAIEKIESARSRLQLSTLKTDFLADKRDVYDALAALLIDQRRPAELFEVLERSRARNLQEKFPGPISLSRLKSALDENTLLLEYWSIPGRLAVLWVTREDTGLAQTSLNGAQQQDLAALASEPDAHWRVRQQAARLLLLDQVPALRANKVQHILLAPDGLLQAIPFDLLPHPAVPSEILLDRADISLLPAASLLLRPSAPQSRRWPWQIRLIVFGDPVLPEGAADLLTGEPVPPRLPNASAEAHAIAHNGPGRARLYLAAADQKSAFFTNATRAPLLHLSTHARADEENPESARIVFSPAKGQRTPDYLFLREIYGVDLHQAELVTLSACETERGRQLPGEGVQSFSRALLAAGGQAAVTSLWRVADQPTAELMKQFYYELYRGAPKAVALQRAKLALWRSGSSLADPRYWAAFVLTGDGRKPLSAFIPWSAIVVPAGAVLLLGVLGLRLRAKWRDRRHSACAVISG